MGKFYKKMKCKLNSTRGVSILFAMLFFLVATTVSVTIVNAALTSVKSINQTKAVEQNSLALESAVGLIKEELGNPSVRIITTVNSDNEVQSVEVVSNGTTITGSTPVSNNFSYELYSLVDQLKSVPTQDATIQCSIIKNDMPTVLVQMTLMRELTETEKLNEDEDDSFELNICCSIKDGPANGEKMYLIYGGNHGTDKTSEGEENVSNAITEYFTWNTPTVSSYEE